MIMAQLHYRELNHSIKNITIVKESTIINQLYMYLVVIFSSKATFTFYMGLFKPIHLEQQLSSTRGNRMKGGAGINNPFYCTLYIMHKLPKISRGIEISIH